MIEHSCAFEEAGLTVRGYLAVDSFVSGSSGGGVRMRADVTPGEIRLLARNMTLKYGFLGIPQGGAKAGIAFDPDAPSETKQRVLFKFGREFSSLIRTRAFVPGQDMGISEAEVGFILEGAGRKPPRFRLSGVGSGSYTGLSVYAGAATALAARGKSVRGAKVAVEGFGKVGASAAGLFFENGAKVVAVSTEAGGLFDDSGLSIPDLARAAASRGPSFVRDVHEAGKIAKADLTALDVDVLCPCALSGTIDESAAVRVRAGIIVGGANVPLTPGAEALLNHRSILVLPDFMTNAGGVLGVFLEIAGYRPAEIRELIPGLIAPRIAELIRESDSRGGPPAALAEGVAFARFERLRAEVEGGAVRGRLFRNETARAIRRMLPRPITKRLGLAFFRRSLAGPMFEEIESRR